MSKPRISVVVPTHSMERREYFLTRLIDSLCAQSFTNFDVIFTKDGQMAENTNAAIKRAQGEIIKILYMDDYLMPDALKHLDEEFTGGWIASGCVHDDGEHITNPHIATFAPGLANTIGSPSVVAFENKEPLLFDESLSWMLDVDLYQRLYERYGFPTIIPTMDVVIGLHSGQTTNLMSDAKKQKEVEYVAKKYG